MLRPYTSAEEVAAVAASDEQEAVAADAAAAVATGGRELEGFGAREQQDEATRAEYKAGTNKHRPCHTHA